MTTHDWFEAKVPGSIIASIELALRVEASLNMAAMSITSLVTYFCDRPKLSQREENHFKSAHVENLSYFQGELGGVCPSSHEREMFRTLHIYIV